ncbi:MAG: Nif3-like dinuclear metal center hexameric protein [Candidatus Delongbacteria bacterium]|nr:Nif3-like dinuclear metal center hexameric protein [Candidatus Delongbacteria bacterium]
MKVSYVLDILNKQIIPSIKWKDDPIGLLIGNKNADVSGILVSLNPTIAVVKEAIEKKCNLIVTHHPLFKNPTNKLVESEYYSDIIMTMIKNDVSFIACHTNYDLVKGGVSYLLAEKFNLKDIKPLVPLDKIEDIEDNDYYKEHSKSGNFGLGVIGELEKEISLKEFSKTAEKVLSTKTLRISSTSAKKIKKVAVCGGSGSSFWQYAFNSGADLFLTSEFNHHLYQEASYYLHVVDATHHSTEIVASKGLFDYLCTEIKNCNILISLKDTDPVKSVNEL